MSLRFLFVNIGYPPFQGGAQVYVRMLAERLVAEGHRVTVLTSTAAEVEAIWDGCKKNLPSGEGIANGVRVVRFPLRHLSPSPYGYYGWRRLTVGLARLRGIPEGVLGRMAHLTPWSPALQRAMNHWEEPVDVVHGFTIPFESLLLGAEALARRCGAAFFITPFLHTGSEDDPAVERSYAMPHQIGLMRRAAGVVALTSIEREFLIRRGVPASVVHAVPAGIPLEAACSDDGMAEATAVLFLGAATYEKGAIHVAEAVRRLRAAGVDITLDVAGTVTGQFSAYFEKLPPEEQAGIRVHRNVSEAEKRRLLARCALLAMPSRVDSFGLVFLEAWAYGKPVIGTQAGGIPEVVDHGENGFLVRFGDVDALAGALRALLTDRELARRMGAAGRDKLRSRYDWEIVYPQLLGLYQREFQR